MNTATASGNARRTARAPTQLDLEDHIVAARQLVVDLGAQRAVQITTVFYPLQELARRDVRFGTLPRSRKRYSRPSAFAGPRCARGGRHRRHDVVELLLDEGDDGPLPGARRPRDHEDRGMRQPPK